MIKRIIAYSIENRFLVLILTLLISCVGVWSAWHMPLDALPDLSDTQAIIYTDWMGRSPDQIENQVTYPLTRALLSVPNVKTVRGFSYAGSSFVYVIFKDGTDIYWARNRITEYLQQIRPQLPKETNPVLGPDATSLGWGFQYALVDESGQYDAAQLRSLQDWTIRPILESVPGVAQVAPVGGFVREYQIEVDQNRLKQYGVTLMDVMNAVRRSNRESEGRSLEVSGFEFMVRGRGYATRIQDFELIRVGGTPGTPIYLKQVATVQSGPAIRRGAADLNGMGETVGGIVVVRFHENVLNVIERVKKQLASDVIPTLPKGVKLVVTYDRTDLIHRAIETLSSELVKLSIVVAVVCGVFLWHLPSIFVIIITLPVAILMAFIMMNTLGITANIMSLSGIAIAIGAMVDAAIIIVENTHKKLSEWEAGGKTRPQTEVVIEAATEVGPSLFFSLLVITVGFLPIFAFQAQAGRLFHPLAWTKTLSMLFAAFLAITLTPALLTLFIKGKFIAEDHQPVSRILQRLYGPLVHKVLRHPKTMIALAVLLLLATLYPLTHIGSEFMPPLDEGTLFYMPVTAPGISISESTRLLKLQDKQIMSIPEVESVFGKAGRAETATDPAPLDMFETVINLKPPVEWRAGVTTDTIREELNQALTLPGVANSFTMPIKARIDMLATGIKTPVGIKVLGSDPAVIQTLALNVEAALRTLPGTRSVYAERLNTGYYLDIVPDRQKLALYGLTLDDVGEVISSVLGGMTLTTTIEGRERANVIVRYPHELRDSLSSIRDIPIPVPAGDQGAPMGIGKPMAWIPLGVIADVHMTRGPMAIRSEQGQLACFIYIDTSEKDLGGYVRTLQNQVKSKIQIPQGYRLIWSGEYEYMEKTKATLMLVIPATFLIIVCLIFMNTRSLIKTSIVLLAVPFSLIGSFWLLWIMGYNMSAAVWVGLIALAGLDAETGIVMLLYLDLAFAHRKETGQLNTREDLDDAITEGAVKRIRPKVMTVATAFMGLLPIMFTSGTGADVMKRIAAPMIGGLISSLILELLVYPAVYVLWKRQKFKTT